MKTKSKTEKEMRDEVAPSPHTQQELDEYIQSLLDITHDYGTCVYAMSLAATASFNYVASKLGVTGFQASCADMDILRRTQMMKGPFMIVNVEDTLYPQYDVLGKVASTIDGWKPWMKEEAIKLLAEKESTACEEVVAHWKKLAK